jgi:phage antirepressor YoqD-like protein
MGLFLVRRMAKIEDDSFDLFLTENDFIDLLKKAGYQIDETGILLKDGKVVKSFTGKPVNIKEDKELSIVVDPKTGERVFIKNIAELSLFLASRNLLRWEPV